MSDDQMLCYCFGVTREDVRRHFATPGAQLDDFIDSTRISTKCAACALDFHALLDEIHGSDVMKRRRETSLEATRQGWLERVDRVDSGFFICDGSIATEIRLANAVLEREDVCVPHSFRLSIFDDAGEFRGVKSGTIGVRESLALPLLSFPDCPKSGWFLLHMAPLGPGYYGTLRPQVALVGQGWVTCYHTQYHTDAAREGRRSGVPLRAVNGRTRAQVSLINGGSKPSRYWIKLESNAGTSAVEGGLPANGATFFDVDSSFSNLPENAMVILRVRSEQPTRKNVIYRHPDGTVGVDHFPNLV